VALVLERDYGIELPKWIHPAVSGVVQKATEATGLEVSSQHIKTLYQTHFVEVAAPWQLHDYGIQAHGQAIRASFKVGQTLLSGQGAGALEALSDALSVHYGCDLEVTQFDQHALTSGTDAQALACMEVRINGVVLHGVAQAEDTTAAALQAMLTAFSRSL
jgi:2-isopropylmalate synthase